MNSVLIKAFFASTTKTGTGNWNKTKFQIQSGQDLLPGNDYL